MDHLLCFILVILAVGMPLSVLAGDFPFDVTFVACDQGLTCPEGNMLNKTFALNDVKKKDLELFVNDKVIFNLKTDVTANKLVMCKNSNVPAYCNGAAVADDLTEPITAVGATANHVFDTVGTYYYGSINNPGTGGKITVKAGGD